MRRPQTIQRVIALAVVFSLSTAIAISTNSRAHAAPEVFAVATRKISPDLKQLLESGNGNTRVKLIVQSTPNNTGLVGGLLQLIGGTVNSLLSNLGVNIVEVTANSANVIAADPRVIYISLDAPVRTAGHVTTTTGTQQVRSQRSALGLPDTLDGSGITIALLDSGIDTRHKSFSSPNKIKFSKDFTGQNRTDDPWGHGTHVAAIAAGDGAPTSGAYEGIAPGASLLNLR